LKHSFPYQNNFKNVTKQSLFSRIKIHGSPHGARSRVILERNMRLDSKIFAGIALSAALLALPGLSLADGAQYDQWGSQMLQQKKFDEAAKYFTEAVKANGKDATAYKGLGYSFAYKGDKAKALPYLKYSLQLNPGDASLQTYISQLESAGPAAPAMAAATGGEAATAIQYGNTYMQQKNYASAVGWFKKATQAEPSNAKAWQLLGNASFAMGQRSEALNAWDQSIALDPTNSSLASYVAQVKASSPAAVASTSVPTVSAPSLNPWVLGGTVAVLGAIMLFVF
jgi:tetratricopeptide (TPR) repeat protein